MATNTVKPDLTSGFDLNQVLACPGCDLLLEKLTLAPGEKLICPRCGETLHTPKKDSINHSLVLALTGLLLFPYAIFMPIMTLDTMGIKNTGTIFDGV
ncbi:MAG: paraquat-inducible protein A, partial [Deltaproteobacteria bacterium]